MATGGLIPTNRNQTVTFYNTAGLIERHKNIYFVPRFSKHSVVAGSTVNLQYLSVFNSLCPPSNSYKDIQISTWSPEDRTLVVKGNIDDFRLVTEEGECLNYCIVKRIITKSDSNVKTYYYAFFITGVTQSGGSSITLSVEPDDFTNVFYLHNKHVLTYRDIAEDYEPFNEKMKNCYVNRQHYNRAEKVATTQTKTEEVRVQESAQDEEVDITETVYSVPVGTTISNLTYLVTSTSGRGSVNYYLNGRNIERDIFVDLGDEFDEEGILTWTETTQNVSQIINKKIFFNQEQSFKYKYQFKDLKYPVSQTDSNQIFTASEIANIDNAISFSSLSQSLRRKIILSCICYQCVETKSLEGLATYYRRYSNNESYATFKAKYSYKTEGLRRPNAIIATPFFNIPEKFEKFSNEIKEYQFLVELKMYGTSNVPYIARQVYSLDDLSIIGAEGNMGNYFYNFYSVNDVNYPASLLDFDFDNKKVYFILEWLGNNDTLSNNPSLVGLRDNMEEGTNEGLYVTFNGESNPNMSAPQKCRLAFSIGNSNQRMIDFNLTDSIPDLRTNFYEVVLEAEPYSFYSFSFLGYELVLNRYRYDIGAQNNIKIKYFSQINNGLKITYAPIYTVEGYEVTYFNEGISFTLSSTIPFKSDSYASYYYENMSRMKAQFAVNDYNRRTDLLQHVFVSGPNAVGYSAGKSAVGGHSGAQVGATALLETANQFMQMLDEGIDWAQSNKNIEMNQKAILADIGRKPDNLKQAGSDVYHDLATKEYRLMFNHYRIDELSYNSIAKLLERIGYQVNLYDTLHVVDRVGWNFIKLNGFDWDTTVDIMVNQEESIRNIFLNGVTLLHDKSVLTSGHNFETILE